LLSRNLESFLLKVNELMSIWVDGLNFFTHLYIYSYTHLPDLLFSLGSVSKKLIDNDIVSSLNLLISKGKTC
jgi:hypothetical protein